MCHQQQRVLTCFAIMVTFALASAPARGADPAAGLAINGLKLTLAAEKTQLKMTGPGMVEKTKLTCTFTNVGARPVKLNAYDLNWSHLRLKVEGPDAESVHWSPVRMKRRMPAPGTADFPTIKPGASWKAPLPITFPGLGAKEFFTLLKRGKYRLTVTYMMTPKQLRPKAMAEGSWTGSVVSNEIVLDVGEGTKAAPLGGKPVNGLKLTVTTDRTELEMTSWAFRWANRHNPPVQYIVKPAKLALRFTNTSDKPIRLNACQMEWYLLKLNVTGPDKTSVQYYVIPRIAPPPRQPTEKDCPILKPGQSWTPGVPVHLPGGLGNRVWRLRHPGDYRLTVNYTCSARHPRVRKDVWTGSVTSNELTLKVLPAGGKPVNGLRLTLAADATELTMTPRNLRRATKDTPRWNVTPTKLDVTFTNVGKRRLTVDAYDLVWKRLTLDVTGPDAESVRVVKRLVDRQMAAPQRKDYPTLRAGGKWTYPPQPWFPGNFGPNEYILLKPGEYRVKVTYNSPPKRPAAGGRPGRTWWGWRGSMTSNEIVLKVAVQAAVAGAADPRDAKDADPLSGFDEAIKLLAGEDEGLKRRAWDALAAMGVKAVPKLLQVYSSRDFRTREAANKVLNAMGGRAFALALLDVAEGSKDQNFALITYDRMKRLKTEEELAPLVAAALDKDRSYRKRKELMEVLAETGQPAAKTCLLLLSKDKNPDIRRVALDWLAHFPQADAEQAMIDALKSPEPHILKQAVESLGRIKSTRAVPALCELVSRPKKTEVSYRAVIALGQIADKRAEPTLRAQLNTPREAFQMANSWPRYIAAVRRALKAIAEK